MLLQYTSHSFKKLRTAAAAAAAAAARFMSTARSAAPQLGRENADENRRGCETSRAGEPSKKIQKSRGSVESLICSAVLYRLFFTFFE